MIDDEAARVAALREVLGRAELPDDVELRPGFGTEYWIETTTPVTNDHGERELAVVIVTGSGETARKAEARVSLDDHAHLVEDGGPPEVEILAGEAAFQISQVAYELVDGTPEVDVDVVAADLGGADHVDGRFVAALGEHGTAHRVSTGLVQVAVADSVSDAKNVDVHVTKHQVFDMVLDAEVDYRRGTPIDQAGLLNGFGMVVTEVDEVIDSLRADERHVVWFEGGFRPSSRSSVPPLRDAPAPEATVPGGDWYAENPGAEDVLD